MRALRLGSVYLQALLYVAAGINHFRDPDFYVGIMPSYLPLHLPLVYVSGVAEIALGLLLLPPRTRRLSGYGLVALLVAVFPANIQMLVDDPENPLLWARLPLQAVLVVWALWATKAPLDGGSVERDVG